MVLAVALATGESIHLIHQRGFHLVMESPEQEESRLGLSCPGCGQENELSERGLEELPEWAECPRCESAYPYRHEEVYVLD